MGEPQLMKRVALASVGIALSLGLWAVGAAWLEQGTPVAAAFAPRPALGALFELSQSAEIWRHAAVSLRRVLVGLVLATLVGVPLGVLVGTSRHFAAGSSTVFQFLRMISPLSWMPLAVMVLGVGDAPVYFLLAFAGVWPVLLNTASGVAQLDPNWLALAQSLSATRFELIWRIVLPGITAPILTGVRLAIGVVWIVLVPAEMLGVSAGLGYFILDTRDRLAYSELMAAILLVGALGFLLDYVARGLHRRWLHVA
jgi:NitT/TauT family transport system permease protein